MLPYFLTFIIQKNEIEKETIAVLFMLFSFTILEYFYSVKAFFTTVSDNKAFFVFLFLSLIFGASSLMFFSFYFMNGNGDRKFFP